MKLTLEWCQAQSSRFPALPVWWGLQRGENRIVLETDKQTDTDFWNIICEKRFEYLEVNICKEPSELTITQLNIEIYDWKTGNYVVDSLILSSGTQSNVEIKRR